MRFLNWHMAVYAAHRWANQLGVRVRVYSGVEYDLLVRPDYYRVWYLVPTSTQINGEKMWN